MLIGLRLILLIAAFVIGVILLAYLFTRNPKFLTLTKRVIVGTLGVAGLLVLVVVLERLLLK